MSMGKREIEKRLTEVDASMVRIAAKHTEHELKACGTCTHIGSPVFLSRELREACKEIVAKSESHTVTVEDSAKLVHEALRLSREKRRCTHEPHVWVHLLDQACAFWQPRDSPRQEKACSDCPSKLPSKRPHM